MVSFRISHTPLQRGIRQSSGDADISLGHADFFSRPSLGQTTTRARQRRPLRNSAQPNRFGPPPSACHHRHSPSQLNVSSPETATVLVPIMAIIVCISVASTGRKPSSTDDSAEKRDRARLVVIFRRLASILPCLLHN